MSIYTQLTPDDIVQARTTEITTGLWSGDTGALTGSLDVLSTQLASLSGQYYVDVYNRDPNNDPDGLAEIQFAVAYGHVEGGGAPTLEDATLATLPTKAIYSQYRNLLLDPSERLFTFNNVESDHIYVINVQRARIREQLDPGNWILPLSGTNGVFTFIDDSNQTLGALTANSKAGRVFNVVSGSLSGGPEGSLIVSESQTYGLVYPDLGIIVLNPNTLIPLIGMVSASGGAAEASVTSSFYTPSNIASTNVVFAPVTQSAIVYDDVAPAYNHAAIFVALKGALEEGGDTAYEFRARSAESIASTHYFVRLRNTQYNYSNNPTFFNPDNGVIINPEFRTDPKVYITTVGLYNEENELLAVAKLSKPVRKSFDEELLLRIRLDF
jgi:hypothetical protein